MHIIRSEYPKTWPKLIWERAHTSGRKNLKVCVVLKWRIAILQGRGWGQYLVFLFPISAQENRIQVNKKSIGWIFIENTMHFTNTYTVLKIQLNWLWWGWQCLRPKIQWSRPPANYSIALQPNAFYHISHEIRLRCFMTSGGCNSKSALCKRKHLSINSVLQSFCPDCTNEQIPLLCSQALVTTETRCSGSP